MNIRHETCEQYITRRLSEGWTIAAQRGFEVILLSPEGIIRPIDVRNDVETLRPNGAGSNTNLTPVGNAANWECVDEVTPDGLATYVFKSNTNPTGWYLDTYALPNSVVGAGTINSVTSYGLLFQVGNPPQAKMKIAIHTHAITYYGAEIDPPGWAQWTLYSKTWINNPNTGVAWTWAEVNALEAGVSGYITQGVNTDPYCTQVYVEISYPGATGKAAAAMSAKMLAGKLI